MPRLDRLANITRNTLLAFPSQINDTTPFMPLRTSLPGCRLSIVTTAGLHLRSDRPFGPADPTYRIIPSHTPPSDIVQSHTSLGFDRVPIIHDINVSFPIDRVRELVDRGELGALAPNCYSVMGAQREVSRIDSETGPALAQLLRDEAVDVALITPT